MPPHSLSLDGRLGSAQQAHTQEEGEGEMHPSEIDKERIRASRRYTHRGRRRERGHALVADAQ